MVFFSTFWVQAFEFFRQKNDLFRPRHNVAFIEKSSPVGPAILRCGENQKHNRARERLPTDRIRKTGAREPTL